MLTVHTGQVRSSHIKSGLKTSRNDMDNCQARSSQVQPGPVRSSQVQPHQTRATYASKIQQWPLAISRIPRCGYSSLYTSHSLVWLGLLISSHFQIFPAVASKSSQAHHQALAWLAIQPGPATSTYASHIEPGPSLLSLLKRLSISNTGFQPYLTTLSSGPGQHIRPDPPSFSFSLASSPARSSYTQS